MSQPQEAEIGEILDAMAAFATSDLVPLGLVKAFGQDIPETYDGTGFPQMMFWGGEGGDTEPRTPGRATTGQWREITEIQGCLVLGPRQDGLTKLLTLSYPWVRKVWSCFWKHQQLQTGSPPVGLVEQLAPVKWRRRLSMPWGTGQYAALIFTWDATNIVRSVTAHQ